MVPGVIAVWSGTRPRFDAYRIPPHADGLVIGRELIEKAAATDDDRISRSHVRLTLSAESETQIADLASRNGTFLDGHTMTEPARRSTVAIMRTGRTIFVLVPDIRPYEHVPISRRGSLVVGGTLDGPCRVVDTAAIEGSNLTIVGARTVAIPLAQSYAQPLGEYVFFRAQQEASLATTIGRTTRPRTIIVELGNRRFPDSDVAALRELQETDVRTVTWVATKADLAKLPASVAPVLTAQVLELPRARVDELPTQLADLMHSIAPGRALHATAIERSLLVLATLDEDQLLDRFIEHARDWSVGPYEHDRGLRGEHLTYHQAPQPLHWCLHGYEVPRRRR